MTHAEKARELKGAFLAGTIPPDELLLHIEPLLVEAAAGPPAQAEAKRIVNGMERVLFTENEPQRTASLVGLLDAAFALAASEGTG